MRRSVGGQRRGRGTDSKRSAQRPMIDLSTLNQSRFFVITADSHGVITTVNPAAERLLGYTSAELVGCQTLAHLHDLDELAARARTLSKSLNRTVHPDVTAIVAYANGPTEQEEWTYRRKDGSLLPVRLSVTRIAGGGKQSASYLLIGKDISIRKRAERLLSESEANLQALIENTEDFVWSVDRSHRIITANSAVRRAVAQLFGEQALESGRLPAKAEGFDIPFEKWGKHYDRALAGERFTAEMSVRLDGVMHFYENSFNPIVDSKGDVTGVAVFSRDVTGRKKAVDELLESDRGFRLLIEAAPVGVILTRKDGGILMVNRHVEELFGYGREEILGQEIELLIPHRFRETHTKFRNGYVQQPHIRLMGTGLQIFGRRKDGTEFPADISLNQVQTHSGAVILTIIFDNTERVKLETSLRKANEASNEAVRIKSEFAATLSHEIRTPLNAIIGVTDLLLRSPLTSQQHEYLDVLKISGETLLEMVNDVLDLAKMEAGKVELTAELFDLKECVETVIGLFEPTASANGVELKTLLDLNLPLSIIGDEARLRQVLVNIIGNALKFTQQGSITLMVKALDVAEKQAELQFSIQDTGIGIPADKIPRLFKPFSQADSSTTREYGGAGLGLSISARLVEMMGGKIWVESKPGEGSTFFFTIACQYVDGGNGRRKETPSRPQAIMPALTQAEADGAVFRTGPSILLAEDNPVNQKVVRELLKTLGSACDVASNGPEVLQALKRRRYDIVLMDVQMPEMDGLDTTRAIVKTMPAEERPVIIALTAHAMKGHREECLAAGMDDYLSKPIRLEKLREVIHRWSGHAGTGSVTQAVPTVEEETSSELERHLETLRGETDPEFIKQLAGIFLSSGENLLQEIAEAQAAMDCPRLGRAAHSLLGAARNMGTSALATHCQEVEAQALGGSIDADAIRRLAHAFEAAKEEILRLAL
jgi:PAS domain S-box-containing protein